MRERQLEKEEKAILAIGNCAGVASVDDRMDVVEAADEAVFYTVKKGDTLAGPGPSDSAGPGLEANLD